MIPAARCPASPAPAGCSARIVTGPSRPDSSKGVSFVKGFHVVEVKRLSLPAASERPAPPRPGKSHSSPSPAPAATGRRRKTPAAVAGAAALRRSASARRPRPRCPPGAAWTGPASPTARRSRSSPAPRSAVICKPNRWASATACLNSARHSGLMNSTGPRGIPTSTSIMITPPMPARLSASKSAVMPSRLRLPSMMNQYTQGRAESGGCRKPCSRSGPAPAP